MAESRIVKFCMQVDDIKVGEVEVVEKHYVIYRQHAQKFNKDRSVVPAISSRTDIQTTDTQTHTHRRTHHNTSQPLPWAK